MKSKYTYKINIACDIVYRKDINKTLPMSKRTYKICNDVLQEIINDSKNDKWIRERLNVIIERMIPNKYKNIFKIKYGV